MKRFLLAAALCVVGLAGMARGQADPTEARNFLAERCAEIGQKVLRQPTLAAGHWRQSAAMLSCAARLNEREPRYWRLLIDAALQAGDGPTALAAMQAYANLQRDDQVVRIQIIDYFLGRMETADKKLEYLQQLIGSEALAPEIRAHAAAVAARLNIELLRNEPAAQLAKLALQLNPLSRQALALEPLGSGPLSPARRAELLAKQLRANPVQPQAATAMANALADAGLTESAMEWYAASLNLSQRMGEMPEAATVHNYAAGYFLSEQNLSAANLLNQVLGVWPADIDSRFLLLLVLRDSQNKENYDKAHTATWVALVNRLQTIRTQIGAASAATMPADSTGQIQLPELKGDVELLQNEENSKSRQSYLSALADLAWMNLYFDRQPAAAEKWLQAYQAMATPEDTALARLRGWSFLLADKLPEAQVKLSAAAQKDPLAALGLLLLEAKQKQPDSAAGGQLLSRYPSGLAGAFIADALKPWRVRVQPGPDAEAVRAALRQLPRNWMKIIDQPQLFYTLRAEPVRITHEFAEPLLAKITLQNVSDADLSIGSDGVIHTDLWLDAQLRGMAQESPPASGYDRLWGAVVLKRGQSLSQVVRVDQGPLLDLFEQNPSSTFQISASVMCNPVGTAQQQVVPGPAGQKVRFDRIMERRGSALTEQSKAKLYDQAGRGRPEEKMRALSLLAAYVGVLNADTANEQSKPMAREMLDMLRRGSTDAVLPVRVWSEYLALIHQEPAERLGGAARMLKESDPLARLLALAALRGLEAQKILPLVQSVERDEDELVRQMAGGLRQAATTQPTTAP